MYLPNNKTYNTKVYMQMNKLIQKHKDKNNTTI